MLWRRYAAFFVLSLCPWIPRRLVTHGYCCFGATRPMQRTVGLFPEDGITLTVSQRRDWKVPPTDGSVRLAASFPCKNVRRPHAGRTRVSASQPVGRRRDAEFVEVDHLIFH